MFQAHCAPLLRTAPGIPTRYAIAQILPSHSIWVNCAVSINLKVRFVATSDQKVADNLKTPYLDVKSLNVALNLVVKIGLTSR